ncbi:hypothetical protein DRO57_02160 [Candidatus Bathyarchaeota archaeon]|nr:MAG: hypothetical protein DRO57_02160 [Candidatus Bathyarchaeota archaeon]
MNYGRRIKMVKERLSKENVDVFMLTEPKNVRYLTGFEGGVLFVFPDSEPTLLVPMLSLEDAEDEAQGVQIEPLQIGEPFRKGIAKVLRDAGASTVFYDGLSIPDYKSLESEGFKLKDGSNYLSTLRRTKDPEEIRLIREASRLTRELMELLVEHAKPGVTECGLAKMADAFLRDRGLEYAFPIIVVSGPKTSRPHGKPSLRKILEGEPVTIDAGVCYMGYCADMTRSFTVGRNPEYEKVVEDVQKAQERALETVRAGVLCKDVDKAAREFLDARGYRGLFIHGLGHGVGLDVHEPPGLNPSSDEKLMEGDVITIEPGVYIRRRYGCRIEDTVLVLKDGFEPLTRV